MIGYESYNTNISKKLHDEENKYLDKEIYLVGIIVQ